MSVSRGLRVCVVCCVLIVAGLWCAGLWCREQQLLEKRMASAGFDLDKYHHLMRTRERYKRYMSSKAAYAAVTGTQHAAQSEAAKLKES